MERTPFAVYRQITLAISWYGTRYAFYRKNLDQYGEPELAQSLVQTVDGIYHSTQQSFVELLNTEGTSVKSKISKGILCSRSNNLSIQQGDWVEVNNTPYQVITVEPVLYNDTVVAYEISIEELVEGNDA